MPLSNKFTTLRVEGPSTIQGGYVLNRVLSSLQNLTFTNAGSAATATATNYNSYVRLLSTGPGSQVVAFRWIPTLSAFRWTINEVTTKNNNTWTLSALYRQNVSLSSDDPMQSLTGTGDDGAGIGTSFEWHNFTSVDTSVKIYGNTRRVNSLTKRIQSDLGGATLEINSF